MNKIEILYFDGCPSWKTAVENLKKVVETEKIPAEICMVKIETPDQVQKEHFLGSPSFFGSMGLICGQRSVKITL